MKWGKEITQIGSLVKHGERPRRQVSRALQIHRDRDRKGCLLAAGGQPHEEAKPHHRSPRWKIKRRNFLWKAGGLEGREVGKHTHDDQRKPPWCGIPNEGQKAPAAETSQNEEKTAQKSHKQRQFLRFWAPKMLEYKIGYRSKEQHYPREKGLYPRLLPGCTLSLSGERAEEEGNT